MTTINVMRRFRIDEISAVDRPAQTPARALLIKRRKDDTYKERKPFDDDEEDAEEGMGKSLADVVKDCSSRIVVLTNATDGHTHAVWLYSGEMGGETGYGKGPDDEESHSHPWSLDQSGNLTIGENNGHAHEVDSSTIATAIMALLTKQAEGSEEKPSTGIEGDGSMPNDTKPDVKGPTQAEMDAMTKRAARFEAITKLSPIEREHFEKMDAAEQDSFIAKTAEERVTFIKALGDADPIVYTSLDGDVFRKSHDPLLVKMAKRADQNAKDLAAERANTRNNEYAKRAGEMIQNLPGDQKVHVAIVKALDTIEDEDVRKAATEAVIAGDKAMRAAFTTAGHGDGRVNKGAAGEMASDKLEQIAKRLQTEKGISYLDAYEKAGEMNPELLALAIEGKPARQ